MKIQQYIVFILITFISAVEQPRIPVHNPKYKKLTSIKLMSYKNIVIVGYLAKEINSSSDKTVIPN